MISLLFALSVLAQDALAPVLVPAWTHPYAISSASMAPGLVEGDVVIADRMRGVCGRTHAEPGDVVIIRHESHPWIRRVVAGPGQRVQMRGGVLHIDGVAVVREQAGEAPGAFGNTVSIWRETLPNGRSYLTQDFGPRMDLDDTPELVVPEGHWFALGDNRDNSIDDRVHGPTPATDLCGVVLRIVRSNDPARIGAHP